jgi:glycosyltransferase involved in cell wall biosynthesis
MRILIFNQYALPAGGAGITRHADLGAELVGRGHSVTIVASKLSYMSRNPQRDAGNGVGGLRFHWVSSGSYTRNDSRRVGSMLHYMVRSTVVGLRQRPRPDVVIGSSPQLLAGVSAALVAKVLHVPFIFEVRDPWPSALIDLGALAPNGLPARALGWVERMLYRSAERIVTVMEHGDDRVAEVGEDLSKCVYIPNASRIPPETAPLPVSLAELMASSHGRTILYAGAHGVSNGLSEVVDAVASIRDQHPDIYGSLNVVLVGDGPEKEGVKARAEDLKLAHIRFHPPVPKPVAMAALVQADFALVHFAAAEFKGFGMSANKLFDAMAAGVPALVATPLRDTPVDTVQCGIRYTPGSLSALANALRAAVLMGQDQRAEMGARGRAEAERTHNIAVTGGQLEALLHSVTRGR